MVQAATAVLESLSIYRPSLLTRFWPWDGVRKEEKKQEEKIKWDLCKCDKLVILPALDTLKKNIFDSEQLLQIIYPWLSASIPGGKARSSEGWILACPMCLFMVQHIIKQHFTGSKLANWRALKRNNELRGSWHAIKKFVIGFRKSDVSPRKGLFLSCCTRMFLSPRADIYGKGELFLSWIQVLTLMYSREATLHCRPEVLE